MLKQLLRHFAGKRASKTEQSSAEEPAALLQRAFAFHRQGNVAAAEPLYCRVLRLDPRQADALHLLGLIAFERADYSSANEFIEQAITIQPGMAEFHNHLGLALQKLDRLDEALSSHRRALELKPNAFDTFNHLGSVLVEMGEIDAAIIHYRKALALAPDAVIPLENLLFVLTLSCTTDIPSIFDEHLHWGKIQAESFRANWKPHRNKREPRRRLKVGYVSGDFCSHVVTHFIEPVLLHHDRGQFEVFGYSNVAKPDAVTRRLESHSDVWREISGLSDKAAAERIQEDGIDILVDLAGHTAGNRLPVFANKPAPVQVSCIGYPNTTGLDAMDYRITDIDADPPGQTERWHTEELVRLPGGFSCYRPPENMPDVEILPASAAGRVTFGSFNKFAKLSDAVISLWARILFQVPGSRLLMMTVPEGSSQERLRQRFASLGIESGRLELHNRIPWNVFVQQYARADIALDPFPCNGGATTCEALWMGVPVVTLAGKAHAGRVGVSLLTRVGLEELIAQSPEEYVEKAVSLAGDVKRLEALRSGMRERMRTSPLMDEAGFTRNLEAAYRAMWERWCARQSREPR